MGQPKMTIFAQCLLQQEHESSPRSVWFKGSWYSSLENLKLICGYGWIWLTRLHRNRHVNLDNRGNRPVSEVDISPTGTVVHLKGYGFVKVFKMVAPDGDIDYWATNNLKLGELQRLQWAEFAWTIRGISSRTQAVLWSP